MGVRWSNSAAALGFALGKDAVRVDVEVIKQEGFN